MRKNRGLVAIAGFLLLLQLPSIALAHAELISSTPAAGAVLTEVPAEAVLTFSEPLDDRSSFAVVGPDGATVATGLPDPAALTTMRATLPALAPGIYEIQSAAGTADGHLERAEFSFTVAEPTPPPPTATPAPTDAPTAAPTPTDAPSPTPGPTPSPSGDGATGTSSTDALVPIVVVGLLVGAGLLFFLRRRGTA